MVIQMENDDDVDFDELISQRTLRRRNMQRGRIPSLRLHTREEDISTEENGPGSEEIQSAATESKRAPSRHNQVIISFPSSPHTRVCVLRKTRLLHVIQKAE